MTSTPSSMLDGLTFRLDDDDERRRCVVCEQMRSDGEELPRGECCCDSCLRDVIECEGCREWFRRAEFLTPAGLDDRCGNCAYTRDMANGGMQ